jgi:hypothetical protein
MQEAQQSGVNANTLNSNAVAKPSVQAATENKPLPALLQLSIVAKTAAGFTGEQLLG